MDAISIWDKADALKRVVGSEPVLKTLVESFLKIMPNYAQQLSYDLSSKDIQAAEKSSHALKGAAANLSTLALADISGSIEQACRCNASIDEILSLHARFEAIFQQSYNVLSHWYDARQ